MLEKRTAEKKNSAQKLTKSFKILFNLLNRKKINRYLVFIKWFNEQHYQQHKKCPLILRI